MSAKDRIPTSDQIGNIAKDTERVECVFLSQRNRNILDLQKSKMSSSQSFLGALQMAPGSFGSNIEEKS